MVNFGVLKHYKSSITKVRGSENNVIKGVELSERESKVFNSIFLLQCKCKHSFEKRKWTGLFFKKYPG